MVTTIDVGDPYGTTVEVGTGVDWNQFLYNTWSQSLRTALSFDVGTRTLRCTASVNIPVFLSIAGRRGGNTADITLASTMVGTSYLFCSVAANNGAFVLTQRNTPVPAAFEMLVGQISDSGTQINALNTGILGLSSDINGIVQIWGAAAWLVFHNPANPAQFMVLNCGANGDFWWTTDAGAAPLILRRAGTLEVAGTAAGVKVFDQGGTGNWAQLARVGTHVKVSTSEGKTPYDYDQATDITLLTGAVTMANGVTNGQSVKVDANGHLQTTQASVPTGSFGTGAGTGASGLTFDGTDQGGRVLFSAGTAPVANAKIVSLVFRNAYAVAPKAVLVGPAQNGNTAVGGAGMVYAINVTTTGFDINSNPSVALPASTTHQIAYFVIP